MLPEFASTFPDDEVHAGVTRFFERAVPAGFDLRTSRIDDIVEAHPGVVGDAEDLSAWSSLTRSSGYNGCSG